ncbi:hypothetical protein SAMN05216551_101486 [Chitinasiproducens palmae]|uniref:Uncharacterized protein n=1 Tax=Chitinasiproducens palmae TaxID=1770053 RepID=A0A1H2PKT2_9BURK|nr:hypothetical protein SAMN05216551_101486 [Chitinasiproducens palmae]
MQATAGRGCGVAVAARQSTHRACGVVAAHGRPLRVAVMVAPMAPSVAPSVTPPVTPPVTSPVATAMSTVTGKGQGSPGSVPLAEGNRDRVRTPLVSPGAQHVGIVPGCVETAAR